MDVALSGRGRRGESGFSIVEVLVASAIFLIAALGLLPLFATSINNNFAGREATDVSNFGRSRIEEYLQMPFGSLVVPPGSTEAVITDYYSKADQVWKAGEPGAEPATWLRRTRLRQYHISDRLDNGTFDTPLDGGTPDSDVHLKEVIVEVEPVRNPLNPLGAGKTVTMRMMRSK
jgi:prepilin-type N-terminal cleavage/methylation domain-containing protein